jgi:hypothetical protein
VKQFVFSVAMAAMLLGGTTFAMATGSGGGGDHGGGSGGGGGGGGGSSGGGSGGGTSDKGDSPGADGDTEISGASVAAECERLIEQRKIGQAGPTSGSVVSLAGRDCDMPLTGEIK